MYGCTGEFFAVFAQSLVVMTAHGSRDGPDDENGPRKRRTSARSPVTFISMIKQQGPAFSHIIVL